MRLILASTLTALASAATSGITATCKEDNTIAVVINHDIEGKILKAKYGSCSKGDVGIDGFAGDHNTTWTGILTPSRCNMDGKLRNLQYNQTAEFTVGREDDGKQLVFTTYDIDTFCEVKNTYTVTFNYGTILPDEKNFTDDGGLIGLHFYFESTDSSFDSPQAVSNSAGDKIYLTLQLNDTANGNFNHAANFSATSGKSFVPTMCFIADKAGKNYTFFDTENSKCKNDIIDLAVSYNDADHVWNIEHTLFLLDNEVTSTYTLTCDVLVCDMQQGTDCKDAHDCLTGVSSGSSGSSDSSDSSKPSCVPYSEWQYWGTTKMYCETFYDWKVNNLDGEDICEIGRVRDHSAFLWWWEQCCPENYPALAHCTYP